MPTEAPDGFKQTAQKIYIVLVSIFLVIAGGDGLYANAKYKSWNIFITPFNILLIALGFGLVYSYVIKSRPPATNQSGSKKALIIVGNVVLILVALLVLIGALTSKNANPSGTNAGSSSASQSSVNYTDPQYGFKITLPPGWTVSTPSSGEAASFAAPQAGLGINIKVQQWQGQSLASYISSGETAEAQSFQNYKQLGQDQAEVINGLPADLITFSGTPPGQSLNLTNTQLILIDESKNLVYGITGVSSSSTWSQNQSSVQKALLSFQP